MEDQSNICTRSSDSLNTSDSPSKNSNSKRRAPAPVPASEVRTTSRRRIKTSRFEFDFLDNEEQMFLQQALKISRIETCRKEMDIPLAPVFYPTLEEFRDTLGYITKIRAEAEPFGICKIVPPPEWKPQCQIDMASPKRFPTKLQQVNTLQEGQGFDDGRSYTLEGYRRMADEFHRQWSEKHHGGAPMSQEQLARDYWEMVETNNRQAAVEYGNDLDTSKFMSGFPRKHVQHQQRRSHLEATSATVKEESSESATLSPDFYATSGWNLNNIPSTDGSVLRFLQTPVNGVNVPWLYLGMLFSSFCWHNEDNYFYSVNYSHFGDVKQWYGVPGEQAALFEKVSKDFLMGLFRESPDLLHHMTTQISPSLLVGNGVNVCKVTQEPGTFIITFPKAYHAGFSYGFNCGEAVNFATSDWLRAGGEAEERYRGFSRESVFSHHRLLFTLLEHQDSVFKHGRKVLGEEVLKVLDEELHSRPHMFSQGVRDLSSIVNLPPNDFSAIDSMAANYDDMRSCALCKHICIFSAVGCECNKTKVSCIRHYHLMCKCAKDKKFLLAWESTSALQARRAEAAKLK